MIGDVGGERTVEESTGPERRVPGPSAGHGFWPYLLPYFGFLLSIELLSRVLPESHAGLGLFLKPMVPAVLLVFFALRGAYPELRWPRVDRVGGSLDVVVGFALAVLWMAPFLWIDALRPEGPGFDPDQLGADRRVLALGARFFGYALVTPIFEELFIRSFVMRYADVYTSRGDFRKLPLARYTTRSFVVTVVVFTLGHAPWEWWVAVPWVALTNLWFYYRKDLWAVIRVHAVTNAAILFIAVTWDGAFTDANGNPISLWFFV